jgi:hypothetical protein
MSEFAAENKDIWIRLAVVEYTLLQKRPVGSPGTEIVPHISELRLAEIPYRLYF